MMMGFGFLGMFLFWGFLILLLAGGGVVLARLLAGTGSAGKPAQPTARQILDARLARGEISPEEYEAILVRMERQ
jgi:putative membrane protein